MSENCAHKQLKKQLVGEQSWYACETCRQKFKVDPWDGKVPVMPAVEQLLKGTSTSLPGGCSCQPGKCMAPVVMGRQTPCRDPKKAAAE